ncbi:Apoptosis regulator BAX [Galemys pyrenaicus]|uniref:Apoptosis regulator BAX n=1 Tax=Galemys pyrenaicus TaxID=202257 RepID=A0A8J6AHD3_GALPY|nr:Apoptosis regulator BAX [Galemys pyrenaicus]
MDGAGEQPRGGGEAGGRRAGGGRAPGAAGPTIPPASRGPRSPSSPGQNVPGLQSPHTAPLLSPLGPTSSEQIMKTGALLLQGFIQDRAGRMAGDTPELALEQTPQDASTKKLSECLKRIGDELDSNMELQRMIAAVDTDSPREVFFRVAAEMFSDGNFNWGRVVALFYFASKLVLKVGSCRVALCTKVPELIRTIMGWTLDFLRERLLGWIQDQGGWDGLLSYFGTPTWQTVTIFVAGVLTASLTIWKKMG